MLDVRDGKEGFLFVFYTLESYRETTCIYLFMR